MLSVATYFANPIHGNQHAGDVLTEPEIDVVNRLQAIVDRVSGFPDEPDLTKVTESRKRVYLIWGDVVDQNVKAEVLKEVARGNLPSCLRPKPLGGKAGKGPDLELLAPARNRDYPHFLAFEITTAESTKSKWYRDIKSWRGEAIKWDFYFVLTY